MKENNKIVLKGILWGLTVVSAIAGALTIGITVVTFWGPIGAVVLLFCLIWAAFSYIFIVSKQVDKEIEEKISARRQLK